MSRHTEDHLANLRTRLVSLMRQESGGNEQEAVRMTAQVMQVMFSELGGQEVYFRRTNPSSNKDILADIGAGIKRKEVCRKHNISKTTYYRLVHSQRTKAKEA